MQRNVVIRSLLLGALLATLLGCASSPVSKNLRQQAKPVTLAQATANPGAYTGTTVIWGGSVIQTVNDTNGGSLYVLQLPLECGDVPDWHGVSGGRFIARSKGFIDPEVFKQGRLVTVAGDLAGVVSEPVQQVRYTYPLLTIRELHLWQVVPAPAYYPGWYDGWYGPWYGPGWGWGWYAPGWY